MATKAELQQLGSVLERPVEEFAALGALDATHLHTLLQNFYTAQTRQRADMEQAIQGALKHIPGLLRGTVLKILRG